MSLSGSASAPGLRSPGGRSPSADRSLGGGGRSQRSLAASSQLREPGGPASTTRQSSRQISQGLRSRGGELSSEGAAPPEVRGGTGSALGSSRLAGSRRASQGALSWADSQPGMGGSEGIELGASGSAQGLEEEEDPSRSHVDSQVFGSQASSQGQESGFGNSKALLMSRSKSTPAPGQYVWRDDVHLRKKPSWSLSVPDRKNLDGMVCSWTPATSNCFPRAPDPGEYGDFPTLCSKNGPPKWTYARASGRPCLAPDPPKKAEITITLPSTFCGANPLQRRLPHFSIYGQDRSQLPYNVPTWTPKPDSDVRPGPGAHDVNRKPQWQPRNRRGCTWGGRSPLPSRYPNLGATV